MEQTDSCQRGGGWKGLDERKKISAKEHIFITHRHRQQCGDGQREGGGWGGWRWAKG